VQVEISIPFIDDALGHSVIYEEYKGDYERARRIAEERLKEARQQGDPALLADALLARGVVHLLQGEPPAALQRFQELEGTVPDDYDRRLRAVSYANLATFWHYNLFPDGGGAGAAELELRWDGRAYLEAEMPRRQEIFAQAKETALRFESMLVKDFISSLQAPRAFLQTGRYSAAATGTQQLLQGTLGTPMAFRENAEIYAAAPSLLAYADLAAADLCQRAGDVQTGAGFLRRALNTYEQGEDGAGRAACHMLWGDWCAAPFSTPRVWNFAIQGSSSSGSHLSWTWEAVEFNQQGAELAQAEEAYNEAERLFYEADAPRGAANVFLRRGYVAMLHGDWADAREAVAQAQKAFAACGERLGYWLAQTQRALCRIGAGQFPEERAIAQAIGAWGAAEGSFSYALGLGLLLGRAGRHWLIREGDYERALACYRLAEALYEALGANINRAQSLVDRGAVFQAIGARGPAVTMYEEALDRYEEDVAARPRVAERLRSHVIMLAADVYQLYLQDMDADGMQRSADRMKAQLDELPSGGSDLGMMAQMLKGGLSSLFAGESGDVITSGVETFALSRMARAFIEQASVLVPLYKARKAQDRGDVTAAEQQFAEAYAAARAASADQKDLLEAQVYAHQKKYPRAKEAFQRYLTQGGANAGFVGKLASVMQTVGGEQGQLEARRQQRRTYEQAFTFMVRVKAYSEAQQFLAQLEQLGDEDWWQADDQPWQGLSDRGEMYEGLDELALAQEDYDRAIAELEGRRNLLSRDELKTALAADKGAQYLYFQAARTAQKMAEQANDPGTVRRYAAQAFGYAERGKARALLDLMVGSAAIAGSGLAESHTFRAWREQSAKLTLWRGLLARERGKQDADQDRITFLRQSIEAEEAALRQFEEELAGVDPGFYQSLNPQADVLSLDQVRNTLPQDTALLQYYFLGDDLLAWGISHSDTVQTHWATLDVKQLTRKIRSFHGACENRQPLDGIGSELADLFLTPLKETIEGAERLIVVPYGAAHLLPFHVLPWRDGEPLGATHTVSYLPSASVLQFVQPSAGGKLPERLLALGDPADMSYTPPLGGQTESARPLPAAATEAEYIASLFPRGKALIGAHATEAAVREQLADDYPILHFATHGRLSEEVPMLSSILLANGEELSLYELMGLRLNADLVVLSACSTGLGETTGGDDVLGLTRGLLAAGARAAVVSLWPVNDVSTSLLMGEFYRQLIAGQPPAAALRAAQMLLRGLSPEQIDAAVSELRDAGLVRDARRADMPAPTKDYSHPHYWAPFILVG
jgi:CHAT domain-containing protein